MKRNGKEMEKRKIEISSNFSGGIPRKKSAVTHPGVVIHLQVLVGTLIDLLVAFRSTQQ